MANKAANFWSTGAQFNRSGLAGRTDPRPLINRAQRCLLKGDIPAARSAAEKAVKLAPAEPTAYLALATVCFAAGDPKRAEANYMEVLRRQPKSFKALLGLGQLKLNSGDTPAAFAILKAALQVEPGNADARHLLARTFGKNNQPEEAVVLFRDLVADVPQDPGAWAGYGRALAALGAAEEAIEAYRRAQELKPEDEAIEQGLAAVYLSIGRIDLAEIHFRNALKIKPDVGTYRHSLARLKRLRDDELSDAQRRLSLLPPNDANRIPLLATIAIIAERTGDYGRSFNATMEALFLINARLPKKYDAAAAINLTDRVIAKIGTRACLQVQAAARPIFIIGMPRSGSTLTEQILARHPSVFAAGEWRAMYKVRQHMHELGKPYPDRLDDLSDDDIGKLRATYFGFLPEAARGRSHITDKALANVYNLASIERMFPAAVIVRTRRHPMDSLWSILQLAYGSNMPYASRIQDICNEVIQQHRVFTAFAERGTLSVMDLFYEELIQRFEEGARSLVSFAGLAWNDACLKPQEAQRAVFTASAGQVHEAISKSSIGRWKPFAPYLTQAIDTLKPFIEFHEAELAKRGINYA